MSRTSDVIKSSYGEFYSTTEPFTPDNDFTVPILQSAQTVLEQQNIVIQNDTEYVNCKAQNDQQCKRLKTELDAIAFKRNNLLDEYNSLNDSLAGCKNKHVECKNMQTNIANKFSEYNTLGQAKSMRQQQLNRCDDITRTIQSEQAKQVRLTSAINQVNTEIDQIKRTYIEQLRVLEERRNATQAEFNRANWFRRLRIRPRLTRETNEYDAFKRSSNSCRDCGCPNCIIKTELLSQFQKELTQSNETVASKRADYNNPAICPVDRYDKYNAIDANQTAAKRAQTFLQQMFDADCMNLPDCEAKFRSLIDAKNAEYKLAEQEYSKKEDAYNLCIDPTKNQCSQFYNPLIAARQNLNKNVDLIVKGMNQEGFCGENSSVDECIQDTNTSADALNDLRSRVNHLREETYGHTQSRDHPMNMRMQSKYHLDTTIYTNIILTTASISILYYMFSRIK